MAAARGGEGKGEQQGRAGEGGEEELLPLREEAQVLERVRGGLGGGEVLQGGQGGAVGAVGCAG